MISFSIVLQDNKALFVSSKETLDVKTSLMQNFNAPGIVFLEFI